jgi:hypothetical protein
MMRYFIMLCLLVCLMVQLSLAQYEDITRWHISAGVVVPTAPEQFYDYWKGGFQVMGGFELTGRPEFFQMVTAEANYIVFDQQRFFKRLGIENTNSSVSGAATYIFSVSYLFKYSFVEYKSFRPSFFAGIGCSDIFRSSAHIQYSSFPVTQAGKNSIVASVPLGASIVVFQRENNIVELNFTYTIGLSKSQIVNSNYACLKLDYSFSK